MANKQFIQSDISSLIKITPDVKTCIQHCYMIENCQSFTFVANKNRCWPKHKTFAVKNTFGVTNMFSGNIAECSGTHDINN